MVAIILTKSWDSAPVALDTANIASAEAIPGMGGAVVHLFAAVAVTSAGGQYEVKDLTVLETPAQIAALQNKAASEVADLAAAAKEKRHFDARRRLGDFLSQRRFEQ